MGSTCRVEPSFVRTFDNVTVDYKINDCEHVLLLDGSKHVPIAVTTRTVEAEKKIVKILSGITEVLLIPSAGSIKVMVNGKPLSLPAVGEQLIKKSPEGKILVILKHFQDNVVSVYVPEQGLQVLSNGIMIEVVAPQLLKSRTVGLCGDMNGEKSADLKTPPMCVMPPHLAALSFIVNKSGSAPGFERCAGIPAALKPEFVSLSTKCPREVIIPTPISKLYEAISASPSRWSRSACPSRCPSSRSLLSLPVSQGHLSWLALLRSVPCLERSSSRRSLSSQLFSARSSSSQLPASLRCPP